VEVKLISLELTCGHLIYVTTTFEKWRREDGKSFYCTICGLSHLFKQPEKTEEKEKKPNTSNASDNVLSFPPNNKK
jgi:transcription elongation factor Elf1